MENNSNFDRVERYLLGHLGAEEAGAFEKEMAQDNNLALEVERQALEHRAMELLHREALRAQFQQWKDEEQDDFTTETKPVSKVVPMTFSRKMAFRFAIAASITLLIGFFVRQSFMGGPDFEAMAMAEFGHSESSIRGDNASDPLAPAYEAMLQKDYQKALTLLDQVQKDYQSLTVLNLRGECAFYLRQFEQATAIYRQLLASNPADGDQREKAEWRLVLSLLAQGKQGETKQLLDKIILEKGQFEEKARGVKDKL